MSSRFKLACLISGGGRTMTNLADRIDDGMLDADVELVIASHPAIAGVEHAKAHGFDVRIAAPTDYATEGERHDDITRWISQADIDLVCLCGYLHLVRLDEPLQGRVINIHPALLPEFGGRGMYGKHVHRAVLAAGKMFSGCTVHFVDEQYDHGPMILQRTCPVKSDDDDETLAARVFEQECLAYPEAIRLIIDRRVTLEDGRVRILPETSQA